MKLFSTIKKLLKSTILGDVKDTIKETIDVAEDKINEVVARLEEKGAKFIHNLVKSLMLFAMIVVGGIFGLVGLAQLISIPALGEGSGYLVIGVGIVLLAVFAMVMQKE